MKESLLSILEDNPIIAAVKDEEGLQAAVKSRCGVVFVLFGNICNIESIVKRLHTAGKYALVHVDLIEGLSGKEIVVDYIKNVVRADGVISSRAPILRAAKQKHLHTVHRIFLIDSLSFHNLANQYKTSQADIIEIMPGYVTPKVLRWVREQVSAPIMTSGLVCDKEDVLSALGAGAIAVSTSGQDVWDTL